MCLAKPDWGRRQPQTESLSCYARWQIVFRVFGRAGPEASVKQRDMNLEPHKFVNEWPFTFQWISPMNGWSLGDFGVHMANASIQSFMLPRFASLNRSPAGQLHDSVLLISKIQALSSPPWSVMEEFKRGFDLFPQKPPQRKKIIQKSPVSPRTPFESCLVDIDWRTTPTVN